MDKFVVMVEGKNCLISFSGRENKLTNLFKKASAPKKTGLFATRFTVAESAADAEKIVIDLVIRELESQWRMKNDASDPPIFLVSETRTVSSTDDPGVTAKGFSFYEYDDRH